MTPRTKINTDEIRAKFKVSEIVGRYIDLKKKGSEYSALCPFHGEKTPSFSVVDAKQFWHCHGCGEHGDIIDFVMKITGAEFRPAVEVITGEYVPDPEKRAAPVAADPKSDASEYRAVMPVPKDAPDPIKNGRAKFYQHKSGKYVERQIAAAWPYRDRDGGLLGIVIRQEWTDDAGKRVKIAPTLTYCEGPEGFTGWVDVSFPQPRPLMNLDQLAQRPDKAVILCEGEKAAAAASRLFPDMVAVTWPNGTNSVDRAEWSALAGRNVVAWPDADTQAYKTGDNIGTEMPWAEQGGFLAMRRVAELLHGVAKIVVIDRPDGRRDGWDAADMEAESVTPADAWIWLKTAVAAARARGPVYEPAAAAPNDEPPHHDEIPAHDGHDGGDVFEPSDPGTRADDQPFRLLGYDRGVCSYLPASGGQIIELTAAGHTSNNLFFLAPFQFWQSRYQDEKGRVDWSLAANALIQASMKCGVFNGQRKRRGRGAWIDAGRNVFHMGDALWVDEAFVDVQTMKTGFVYETGESVDLDLSAPLQNRDAIKTLDMAREFSWESPLHAYLLAGACVVAPVCGVLPWRPHIWIVGPSGSGKTSVMTRFVGPLISPLAFIVEGATTEAGIRQSLEYDARPVLFDEAEGKDDATRARIRTIIDLARVSSTDSGGEIVKGGSAHKAKGFRVRSCFIFSSVNPSIEFHADETRITQLALMPIHAADDAAAEAMTAKWETLSRLLSETLSPEYIAGMIARTVRNLVALQHNCEVFTRAAAAYFGSMRAGQQYGPMLAGAYLLHSTGHIEYSAALKWLQDKGFNDVGPVGRDDGDERQLIARIMQHRERATIDQGRAEEFTVSELLEMAVNGAAGDLYGDRAEKVLQRLGLRLADGGLWVANKHSGLSKVLSGSPWASGWSRTLSAIPGAQKSGKSPISFSRFDKSRAVWLPLSWLRG
ncbi:MAG: CHC2 zinc finger domain-containing protein [Parvibaculum sp.]|nr:CHC2 zinc finger domain-containing protein [Parvibaculum sp.]